jgi:16S rRNA (cytosine1402-N4)-methyltransferase
MRYNIKTESQKQKGKKSKNFTAEKVVNKWSLREIEKILKDYGQERFAKRIARAIIRERNKKPIKTTFQLVEIIRSVTPPWYHRKKLHPAAKTFQALRIAVNNELDNLKKALPQAIEILEPGGRLVVISFHSLEDRIVKIFLKEYFKKGHLKILVKKPIRPQKKEIKLNPCSRSAKLRAGQKL